MNNKLILSVANFNNQCNKKDIPEYIKKDLSDLMIIVNKYQSNLDSNRYLSQIINRLLQWLSYSEIVSDDTIQILIDICTQIYGITPEIVKISNIFVNILSIF
jgi:hypothetical protein